MRLFIAEKPSMAREIAKVLEEISNIKAIKKKGFIQIGSSIITWQFGHLLELKKPEQLSERYKLWSFENLPILPKSFIKEVKYNCKEQFDIIKSLVNSDKVIAIIHAGDPDREGELLVRETLEYLNCKKPVKRILLNALDNKSIKYALNNLKDDTLFDNLYISAKARAEADWLIGMNLSRAYTLVMRKSGYDKVINVGRVMTPTLCLVVQREKEITNFKPITHYKLEAVFRHQNGIIKSKLRLNENSNLLNADGYILNKQALEGIQRELEKLEPSKITISKYETAQKTEKQHLPYSLSNLQIEAGKRYGYDPQKVLNIAQELYEKKFTTYPRSDCDYLPTAQLSDAKNILENLSNIEELKDCLVNIDVSIKSHAWNDDKISAHHAIIPTTVKFDKNSLSEEAFNIYLMIATAYIAQFLPIYKYNQTDILIEAGNYEFATTGRTVTDLGWKKLYTLEKETDETQNNLLPQCKNGDKLIYVSSDIKENITSPPKRFTTSTLLAAMKNINKYVKNKQYAQLLKTTSGIGTEATRAGIIDKLFEKGFLQIDKKNIIPTPLSLSLVKILPKELIEPDLTAVWEDWLTRIADGTLDVHKFYNNQNVFVCNTVNFAKTVKIDSTIFSDTPKCPYCGSSLKLIISKKVKKKYWICTNCDNCKKGFFVDYEGIPVIVKCPVCKKGYLRQITGKNGVFWSCENYPNCKATFNDNNNKPVLKMKKKVYK